MFSKIISDRRIKATESTQKFKEEVEFPMRSIQEAKRRLTLGELVILPTETVYGLACDATQDQAVLKVYDLKGRPSLNPLIIHCSCLEMARQWAFFPETAVHLAHHFWEQNPKPLTLVLKRFPHSPLSPYVTAGLETVAVRIPHHPVALNLLREFNSPLAAPSANLSQKISPTTTEAVRQDFGEKTPFILEGGPCRIGIESTILDMTNAEPILLRAGGTPQEEIEMVLGSPLKTSLAKESQNIRAPGMLKRHYAPSRPLRLNVMVPYDTEAFLGFGREAPSSIIANLSSAGNLEEAAANLFTLLRKFDKDPYTGIAVMPIPQQGLGIAINDRLKRGSVPSFS